MWSTTPEHVELEASPSLLSGNLSKVHEYVAYATLEDVAVVNYKTGKTNKISLVEKTAVYNALIAEFDEEKVVIICNESGCQVWDYLGEHLYFSLALSKDPCPGSETVHQFCRGICAEPTTKSIVVGSSAGKLYKLVQTPRTEAKDGDFSEFQLQTTVTGHNDAIHAIASNSSASTPLLCSSDDDGCVIVWTVDDNGLEVKHKLKGSGYPVTTLRCFESNWLLTGDTTGKLRLVDLKEGIVAAEVGAHSRNLSGMDKSGNVVVTVGEDAYLNVWKLKEESSGSIRIALEHSHRLGDDLITGVAFSSPSRIMTVAYDSLVLKVWVNVE